MDRNYFIKNKLVSKTTVSVIIRYSDKVVEYYPKTNILFITKPEGV